MGKSLWSAYVIYILHDHSKIILKMRSMVGSSICTDIQLVLFEVSPLDPLKRPRL